MTLQMRCAVRLAAAAGCAILGCANLPAQTPAAAKPEFEVASVKPTASDIGRFPPAVREMFRFGVKPGAIPMEDRGRIHLVGWALLDLIAAAYSVRASEVSGPGWISDQAFDVEAKVPEGTPKEQLHAMLQSLLEERFGLKVHRDTQTKQGFALVIGKDGPKLKPAGAAPTPEQREQRSAANRERLERMRQAGTPLTGLSTLNLASTDSEGLAAVLVRFVQAPVADETGLTGKYSATIETWQNDDVPGGTIFDAVEKLGLKLEPRKMNVERIVVDQVSKTPTTN
jgi:uncharacterized protein (TIGR03435 family)